MNGSWQGHGCSDESETYLRTYFRFRALLDLLYGFCLLVPAFTLDFNFLNLEPNCQLLMQACSMLRWT